MAYSVLVDFDGTIALEDTTDLVLERFADPQWRKNLLKFARDRGSLYRYDALDSFLFPPDPN